MDYIRLGEYFSYKTVTDRKVIVNYKLALTMISVKIFNASIGNLSPLGLGT